MLLKVNWHAHLIITQPVNFHRKRFLRGEDGIQARHERLQRAGGLFEEPLDGYVNLELLGSHEAKLLVQHPVNFGHVLRDAVGRNQVDGKTGADRLYHGDFSFNRISDHAKRARPRR